MVRCLKWLVSAIVAVMMLAVPFAGTNTVAFAETAKAKLVVVGDAVHKVMVCPKEVDLQEGDTALTVLQRTVGAENVAVVDTSYGPYLTGISGLTAGDGGPNSYWGFRVNDAMANEGAGSYAVKAGDIIEFRYILDWNNPSTASLGDVLTELGGCTADDGTPDTGGTTNPTPNPNPPAAVQAEEVLEGALQYILKNGVQSDWQLIGAVQSGYDLPAELVPNYLQSLKDYVSTAGRLENTGLARTILAVTAAGGYAEQFAGKNLVEKLYNDASIERLGTINAYAYALLALNSRDYEIPAEAKWTREKLVQHILSLQHTDGSWAFSGALDQPGDVDMTGMVMTALAPVQEMAGVQEALGKAKQFLQAVQHESGGFGSGDTDNSNSTAQAMMGLLSIGVDPASEEFTKNGYTPLHALASFQLEDGSFMYTADKPEASSLSTEQALYTLVQYEFFLQNQGSIFHWTLAAPPAEQPDTAQPKPQVPASNTSTDTSKGTSTATTGTTVPVTQTSGAVQTSTAASGQKLPDTALFGTEEAAAAAAGLVLMAAGAVVWKRRNAA